MFIRTKTTPKSPRRSVRVVETLVIAKQGKVKQKILRYVGIAMDEREEEKFKALATEVMAKLRGAEEAQLAFS